MLGKSLKKMSFLARKTLCCFCFPCCCCCCGLVCFLFSSLVEQGQSCARGTSSPCPAPSPAHAVRSLLQGIVPESAHGKPCLPSGQHSRGSSPAPEAWGTAGLLGREGGTGGSQSPHLKHGAGGCTQVKGMKQGGEDAQALSCLVGTMGSGAEQEPGSCNFHSHRSSVL